MIKQLSDTGSLKSKRQMTPSSLSVLGLIVWNLPSSTCKKLSERGNFSPKSRIVASSAGKRSRTQLLATTTGPIPRGPPTHREQTDTELHHTRDEMMGTRAATTFPEVTSKACTHRCTQQWQRISVSKKIHTQIFTPKMNSKLASALIHILKRYILSLISNSNRPRFKQHC